MKDTEQGAVMAMRAAKSRPSILWKDSAFKDDVALITELLQDSSFKAGYLQEAMDQILTTIGSSEWQAKYTSRTFVFCAHYARSVRVMDIKFALCAQVIDALYFLESRNPNVTNFETKFAYIFNHHFGWKPNHQTGNAIRILRNNVMHTGSVPGMPAARGGLSPALREFINAYREDGDESPDEMILYQLAASVSYLTSHLVLRTLGVGDDAFRFNGSPPEMYRVFEAA